MRTAPALPGFNGTHLVEAGVDWDVIRVSGHLGLQAVDRLQAPGSVVIAPAYGDLALYFFVKAGSTRDWHVAQTAALRGATFVVIPPTERTRPPGPYWLVPPQSAIALTDTNTLETVIAALLQGPGEPTAPPRPRRETPPGPIVTVPISPMVQATIDRIGTALQAAR